jgi:hypothetical protein
VVRHVEDLGGERDAGVQHRLLGVRLRLVREQDPVLAAGQHDHERVVVRVGVRVVPAPIGREELEPEVADGQHVAGAGVPLRDPLPTDGLQERPVRGRPAVGGGASGVEHDARRHAGEDGGEAEGVVEMGMGRDDRVEPLHAERRQLRRDEIRIRPPVDEHARPAR